MILAAGYGTRLRPVTYTLPKPLVPVCNRPLIAWAVEAFLRAGVRELIVNLHHLPEPLERFLTERYGDAARFDFSFEPEILGTGGGIRKVRPLLEHEKDFFLVNGDTIQFPPWDELRRARRDVDALAALTLRHPPAGDKFTPVYFDAGEVTGFGQGLGEPLMFAGSHVISSRIFRWLPEKEFSGIVDEVYQPVIESDAERVAGVVDDGLWFDVGNPQRYDDAHRALLDLTVRGHLEPTRGSRVDGTSLVDESAKVGGSLDRSTVGARSIVDGDLRETVVWDDCRIARGVTLEGCIVAHGVTIAEGEYRDVLICNDAAGERVSVPVSPRA